MSTTSTNTIAIKATTKTVNQKENCTMPNTNTAAQVIRRYNGAELLKKTIDLTRSMGIPFECSFLDDDGDFSPCIVCMEPKRGYVPGNVAVVSVLGAAVMALEAMVAAKFADNDNPAQRLA